MDPNANLDEQLKTARRIMRLADDAPGDHPAQMEANAERLAELVIALDEWIRKGGFLPSAWKEAK